MASGSFTMKTDPPSGLSMVPGQGGTGESVVDGHIVGIRTDGYPEHHDADLPRVLGDGRCDGLQGEGGFGVDGVCGPVHFEGPTTRGCRGSR